LLSDKLSANTQSVINAINEGTFEANSMKNVLTYILDFLSDTYFMKISFNRFCKNTDASIDDVASNEQITTGITQINTMILETENNTEKVENSLPNLVLMRKITQKDMLDAKRIISGIKEMIIKHSEVNWYGIIME